MKKWLAGLVCAGMCLAAMCAWGQAPIYFTFEAADSLPTGYAAIDKDVVNDGTESATIPTVSCHMVRCYRGNDATSDKKVGSIALRMAPTNGADAVFCNNVAFESSIQGIAFQYASFGTDPAPASFLLQVSSDGSTWTDVADLAASVTNELQSYESGTLPEGAVFFRLFASDTIKSNKRRVNVDELELTFGGSEFSVAVTPASPTTEAGTELTLTAEARNGTEPYTYAWSGDLGTGSGATFTVADDTAEGEYEVTVEATDADDATATATVTVVVTAPVAKYAITYAVCENGSVSGPSEAAAGESVTVTATPDAGYRLAGLTANGDPISATFEMPAEDVEIAATFEEKPAGGGDDVLTRDDTGVTGTSYSDWSGVSKDSGAVYAGNSAGGNSSIQLRSSNNNSGIVMTGSGGNATQVTVEWEEHTAANRVLDIYGKDTAYTAASDLYGDAKGTLLGSITNDGSTTLVIEGEYPFIGMRSKSSAMYLTSVTISFGSVTPTEKFAITYANCSNGSVSGPAEAAENATVNVTATPDAGYRLASVTVDGSAISGTSFTMPGHAVTVAATFEAKSAGSGFAKIASMDDLTEGDYVIVGLGSASAMKNETAFSTSAFTNSPVTIEDDQVTDADETVIWHLAYDSAAGGWTLYNEAVGKYAAYISATSKANSAKLVDEATELSAWTITYDDGFCMANVAVANNSSNRVLAFNSPRFACYTAYSSSIKKLDLYKGDGAGPGPSVSFDRADGFSVKEGDVASITATAKNFAGEVTFTWTGTGGSGSGSVYTLDTATAGAFSATVVASDGTDSVSATINWTVKAQPSGSGFTKIMSTSDLVPGTYVIVGVGSANAMSATVTSDYLAPVGVSIEDGVVQTDNELLLWTLDTDGSTWSIASSEEKFVASTVAKKMSLVASADENTARWSITGEDGVFTVANGAVATNLLQYNSSNPRFTTYNSKQTKLELYLGSSGPAAPKVTLDKADGFTVKEGAEATITATAANFSGAVTWNWSGTDGGSGSGDTYTINTTVAGSYSAMATATYEGETASKTVSFKVKAGGGGTYEKISSLDDLTEGDYVIVGLGSANAMDSTVTSGNTPYLNPVEVTIADDLVEEPEESLVWHLEENASAGGWTIYSETAGQYVSYISATSAKNAAQLADEASALTAWTVTYDEGFSFENVAVGAVAADTNRYLAYNPNPAKFACYKAFSSSAKKLELYKASGPTGPSIAGVSSLAGYVGEELSTTFAARNLGDGVTVTGWTAQNDGGDVGTIVDGVWTWASPTLGDFTLVVTATLSDSSTLTKNVAVSVTERPQEWAVTVQATGCNALANPTQALAGTQVTVTFEPFQNYEFVSLTVNGVAQTPVGNQVTFTMPNEAVTVVVTCVAQPGSPFLTCEEGTSVNATVNQALVLHFTLSNGTMVEDDDSYLLEQNLGEGVFSEITETTFTYTWTPTVVGVQELDFEVDDEEWEAIVPSYVVTVTVTNGDEPVPTEVAITSISVKDGAATITASGDFETSDLMYSTNLVEWTATPVEGSASIGFIRIGTPPAP